jgi:hypothetical protein
MNLGNTFESEQRKRKRRESRSKVYAMQAGLTRDGKKDQSGVGNLLKISLRTRRYTARSGRRNGNSRWLDLRTVTLVELH